MMSNDSGVTAQNDVDLRSADEDDEALEREAQLEALNRSQCVIEFSLDGTVLDANKNFLALVGYTLDEIKGKHHRMFLTEKDASSIEYARFWRELADGRFRSSTFRRVGKGGAEVWLQTSYNPLCDRRGKP
jgi:methyl-accepting chemotaxis protein